MDIDKNRQGHETLFVHEATVSKLASYLNPDVPYVWVLGHMPNSFVEWWDAELPLSKSKMIKAKVRLVTYDFQVTTKEFLGYTKSPDDHGIVLVQSNQEMPDTLDMARIPDKQQDSVLIKNGAFLRMYLPHSYETAYLTCYKPGYLESVNG